MKMKDIETLSEQDLINKIEELKTKQFDMRIQKTTSGIEKSHEIRATRKDIARLKTQQSKLRNTKAN